MGRLVGILIAALTFIGVVIIVFLIFSTSSYEYEEGKDESFNSSSNNNRYYIHHGHGSDYKGCWRSRKKNWRNV